MNLTTAQLSTLKAAISAETTPAFVGYRNANDKSSMAAWYNGDSSPAYIVYKTNVAINEVGKKFNGTELAGVSSLNQTRLQTIGVFLAAGVNPSLADNRAFFDDVFSGAGGTTTRANLLALWKRTATRFEKLYATGNGADLTPSTLVVEGQINGKTITAAMEAP